MKRLFVIMLGAATVSSIIGAQNCGRGLTTVTGHSASNVVQPNTRANPWALPSDKLLGFIEIPGGPFVMGTDSDDKQTNPIERPRHTVSVRTYFVGQYEVTVAQFTAFVKDAGYQPDPRSLEGPLEHPVRWVSWHDAVAYCDWLTANLRESAETPADLARLLRGAEPGQRWSVNLPSEAEWERAARGTDGRIYPWGNELGDSKRANYDNPSGPVAVGSYPTGASPYGVLDVAGNVLEWTRSISAAWRTQELRASGAAPIPFRYPYRWDDGRETVDTSTNTMLLAIHGGSFSGGEQFIRTTFRGAGDPRIRQPNIGFRVVVSQFVR